MLRNETRTSGKAIPGTCSVRSGVSRQSVVIPPPDKRTRARSLRGTNGAMGDVSVSSIVGAIDALNGTPIWSVCDDEGWIDKESLSASNVSVNGMMEFYYRCALLGPTEQEVLANRFAQCPSTGLRRREQLLPDGGTLYGDRTPDRGRSVATALTAGLDTHRRAFRHSLSGMTSISSSSASASMGVCPSLGSCISASSSLRFLSVIGSVVAGRERSVFEDD